jgi:hypothetical protein
MDDSQSILCATINLTNQNDDNRIEHSPKSQLTSSNIPLYACPIKILATLNVKSPIS